MKISKEKLIKLFKDGIVKLEINNLNEMRVWNESGRINIQSFIIQDVNNIFGAIQICINPTMGWFISFFPNDNDGRVYDHSAHFEHEHKKDAFELKCELTKSEFEKLSKIFKRKYTSFEKKVQQKQKQIISEKNVIMNRKLEILSDEFELDFFPKNKKSTH